jgi:hypothetical protein
MKILSKTKSQTLLLLEYLRPCSCVHRIAGAQVPPEPTPFVNSARGVRKFGFWGAFMRLPTSTTATSPDSLQRLHCYDDDMADPTSSSTAAVGYLSLSPLFIYLFLFLSVLQYACIDVLQSSFKYACLECVTFKLSICLYVIIMSNNFWIKIMRKFSIFLTIQKPNYRQFSVTGFAVVLKPTAFDGKHFMT